MKERKVIIVKWPNAPENPQWHYSVTCDHCDAELLIPSVVGTRIIASKGMDLVFDNTVQPPNAIPDEMRCPVCRHTFERMGARV